MNKKLLLVIAGLLILFGLIKPDLSSLFNRKEVDQIVVVTPPSDTKLREACGAVIEALKSGGSSRVKDGLRLSDLAFDLSTLVELDGEDMVIKTTDDLRFANALSGPMLRMDIKGKYPELAKAANAVIIVAIGEDNIPLDPELRAKAVEGFRALSWAFVEGTK